HRRHPPAAGRGPRRHSSADREVLDRRSHQLHRRDPPAARADPGAGPHALRGRRLRPRPRPRGGAAGGGEHGAHRPALPARGGRMSAAPQAISGIARLGKRTKDLTKRLESGDIAIIDHEDIDRVAAEALVERRPAAVLNVSASTSGRYPNAGPQILVDAGIALIDAIGPVLFEDLRDGEVITLGGATVLR